MRQPPTFSPPGPGTWEMDAVHFPRAVFGAFQRVFPPAFEAGFRDCCARYGLLLETMDVRFVHGFPYMQPRIVGAPPGGGKSPPRPIFFLLFKLLTALHPETRRRMSLAKTVFQRRPWLKELRDWDERVRPQTILAHRALDSIDPVALDDTALGHHCLAVEQHATRMLTQDHSYNLTFMVPLGDYLAHARAWTGLDNAALMAPLIGHSDISAGDSAERRRLLAALQADPEASAVLERLAGASETTPRPSPREVVERLKAWSGEVGEAMRDWCLIVGNSLAHGLELETPTVNEDPGPGLQALRAAGAKRPTPPRDGEAASSVRARVPAEHQAQFDVLLDDARLTYRLRDERHLYGVMPTFGIARRAMLEAGRRLTERGLLTAPKRALLCDAAELAAMLEAGQGAPAELDERVAIFEGLTAKDAPARLGPPPAEPPPLDWLPNEGARRLMAALDLYMKDMREEEPGEPSELLKGLPVSRGVVEGIARVCRSAADLTRVQQGDILVAPLTSPAINIVLPLLGGIVTDKGGALSHAAIVAREYGIPGVVGTREATARIPEGARLRVDGETGQVTVLS